MKKTYVFLLIFIVSSFLILKKVVNTLHKNKAEQVQLDEPATNQETQTTPSLPGPGSTPVTGVATGNTGFQSPPASGTQSEMSYCQTTMLHCLYKEQLLEYPSEQNPWSAETDNSPVSCFAYTSSCTNMINSRPVTKEELDAALETYRMNHPQPTSSPIDNESDNQQQQQQNQAPTFDQQEYERQQQILRDQAQQQNVPDPNQPLVNPIQTPVPPSDDQLRQMQEQQELERTQEEERQRQQNEGN